MSENTTSTGGGFNPAQYLRKLGRADYLEVKWRLLWLRTEHPDAIVSTELVKLDLDAVMAVFRATVTIPGGGSATGYGSETVADFVDFIEKAETKSIGRALAALGYGTQFCQDHDLTNADGTPHVVDSPIERPSPVPSSNGHLATPAQLKLIYLTAKRDLHVTEEALEEECMRRYGRLPANLTKREASEYIDSMKKASPNGAAH